MTLRLVEPPPERTSEEDGPTRRGDPLELATLATLVSAARAAACLSMLSHRERDALAEFADAWEELLYQPSEAASPPRRFRLDARADEDREWELYRARWQESDLPREPELRHTARRALVRGGIWMRSQVRKRSDAELLAIENVGPKTVAQLREAIDD